LGDRILVLEANTPFDMDCVAPTRDSFRLSPDESDSHARQFPSMKENVVEKFLLSLILFPIPDVARPFFPPLDWFGSSLYQKE